MLSDEPTSWPVVGTRDIHRDNWVVGVREDQVTEPPGGEPFGRLVIEHPGAVAVLAIDACGRALVVRQYRHSVQATVVEIPAGLLDAAGESPLETAQRELQEEAGYAAARWTHLLTTLVSPGMTTQVFHFFLAQDLSEVGHGDFVLEHEEAYMTTEWVPWEDLLDAVLDGRARNGATATAVMAYAVRRQRGEFG